LEGLWFDRTQEYLARRRGETFDHLQYATRETLELDPLPCWEHLTPGQRRARVAILVEDIESEAGTRRRRKGAKPLGVAAVLSQNPFKGRRRSRSRPLRPSTRRARPCVVSSGTPILCSWPPTVSLPKSSGPGFARWHFLSGASRQRFPSWADSPAWRRSRSKAAFFGAQRAADGGGVPGGAFGPEGRPFESPKSH
jgi:hypothetical protein